MSTSPLAHASKNDVTVAVCRCSISAFNARQLEKPWSCATDASAVASLAPGSALRRSSSRSFASFFRYSSDAPSGSAVDRFSMLGEFYGTFPEAPLRSALENRRVVPQGAGRGRQEFLGAQYDL